MAGLFRRCFCLLVSLLPAVASAVPCAGEIHDLMQKHAYLQELKDGRFTEAGIASMDAEEFQTALQEADIYASYTTPDRVSRLVSLRKAGVAGVGMDIIRDREKQVRCLPNQGSPAAEAGIEHGNTLLAVDGFPVDSLTLDEIAQFVRGAPGTDVTLTVENTAGYVEEFVVTRAAGDYPDVTLTLGTPGTPRIMRPGPRTSALLNRVTGNRKETGTSAGSSSRSSPDVLRITRFGPKTAAQLAEVLAKLSREPQTEKRRLVLDLRGNTGGVLEQAALCTAMFLADDAVIYRYRSRAGIRDVLVPHGSQKLSRRFLIRQDEFTASSAEMMINALRHGADASSFGSRSGGKARVQNVFPLSDGSYLKFTVGELQYLDTEGSWQGTGLKPDVETGPRRDR